MGILDGYSFSCCFGVFAVSKNTGCVALVAPSARVGSGRDATFSGGSERGPVKARGAIIGTKGHKEPAFSKRLIWPVSIANQQVNRELKRMDPRLERMMFTIIDTGRF